MHSTRVPKAIATVDVCHPVIYIYALFTQTNHAFIPRAGVGDWTRPEEWVSCFYHCKLWFCNS